MQAFYIISLVLETLGFFDGDNAIFTDLLHDIGDQFTDLRILSGDGGHLDDLVAAFDRGGHTLEFLRNNRGGLLDTTFESQRLSASSDILEGFIDNGLRQQDGGSSAVASSVIGLGRRFFNNLAAHVLKGIRQINVAGNGHTVVNNGGGAPGFGQGNRMTLRSQGYLYRIRKGVNTFFQGFPDLFTENNLFCHFISLNSFIFYF